MNNSKEASICEVIFDNFKDLSSEDANNLEKGFSKSYSGKVYSFRIDTTFRRESIGIEVPYKDVEDVIKVMCQVLLDLTEVVDFNCSTNMSLRLTAGTITLRRSATPLEQRTLSFDQCHDVSMIKDHRPLLQNNSGPMDKVQQPLEDDKMGNILCRIGWHRPLGKHVRNFTDVVSGKTVYNAECSCGETWLTDSTHGFRGHKTKRSTRLT